MLRISRNVVIPTAYWSSQPPSHPITCIITTELNYDIVTGSDNGHIIIWRPLNNGSYSAKWLLIGHLTSVKGLCLIDTNPADSPNKFFSYSESSELALWSWSDGKCLEFKQDTKHLHFNIQSHKPTFLDHRLLFCCGDYPYILVLHANTLSSLFKLASSSQPGWISTFTAFTHPNQRDEVVLGLSHSNHVTLWTLNGQEIQGETKYEHESKPVDCSTPILRVQCCPQALRYVLLVSSSCWQLMDAVTCSIFARHPITNDENDQLVGGEFIDRSTIAIFTRLGLASVYRISISTVTKPDGSSQLTASPPVLIAQLSMMTPNPTQVDPLSSTSPVSYFTTASFSSLFDFSTSSKPTWRLTVGSPASSAALISTWSIQLTRLTNQDSVVRPSPSSQSSLADQWRQLQLEDPLRHIMTDPTISPTDNRALNSPYLTSAATNISRSAVCACIQFSPRQSSKSPDRSSRASQSPLLALGLTNGLIVLMPMTAYLESPFSLTRLPPQGQLQFLQGHTAPISCLLHPASSCWRPPVGDQVTTTRPVAVDFDPNHLVSASLDCTVRLWNVSGGDDTSTCLSVFRWHSEPVIGLVAGPSVDVIGQPIAGNVCLAASVCSISRDGSVCLFNLVGGSRHQLVKTSPSTGSNRSPVVAVGWRIPHDLLAIARLDGSLEVWDLIAGCLDRLETGQSARDLADQFTLVTVVHKSAPLSHFAPSLVFPSSSHPSTDKRLLGPVNSPYSSSGPDTCPVQLIAPPAPPPSTPVQLHAIGQTSSLSTSGRLDGLVFHWDLTALATNIILLQSLQSTSDDSNSVNSSPPLASYYANLVCLLIRLVHPWTVNQAGDEAVRHCLISLDRLLASDDPFDLVAIPPNLSLGFVSKNGSLTLSLPDPTNLGPSRFHSLTKYITTNLLLTSLTLAELFTSLPPTIVDLVKCESSPTNNKRAVFDPPGGSSFAEQNSRDTWLHLAEVLCQSLLPNSNTTIKQLDQLVDFGILLRKWQDLFLPIRYASRTLLLTCLDSMGHEGRQRLLTEASPFLPTSSSNPSMGRGATVDGSQSRPSINGETETNDDGSSSQNKVLFDLGHPQQATTPSSPWIPPLGYRVSARAQAKLQATSVILFAIVGTRYGSIDSEDRSRSRPADAARDLTDQLTLAAASSSSALHSCQQRLLGLGHALPNLTTDAASIDNPANPLSSSALNGSASVDGDPSLVQQGFAVNDRACQPPVAGPPQPPPLDQQQSHPNTFANQTDASQSASSFNQGGMPTTTQPSATATTAPSSPLRRIAIDLIGRGFSVWEPYIDLGHTMNALLLLASNVDRLKSVAESNNWLLSPRLDLALSAREALWAIGLTRPATLTLTLSLEVKRLGSQLYSSANNNSNSTTNSGHRLDRRSSSKSLLPSQSSSMTVVMSSPATGVGFMMQPQQSQQRSADKSTLRSYSPGSVTDATCQQPPLLVARQEVLHLFEQLCSLRSSHLLQVLSEAVEIVMACVDRIQLKERGLDVAFAALRRFPSYTSNTRVQKACVGDAKGSLAFFDFKAGRYLVVHGHSGPIDAVRFHSEGRMLSSYSSYDNTVRIWQLHSAGLFNMYGGQQVKPISSHPVPPLKQPSSASKTESPAAICLEWTDAKSVQLLVNKAVFHRISL